MMISLRYNRDTKSKPFQVQCFGFFFSIFQILAIWNACLFFFFFHFPKIINLYQGRNKAKQTKSFYLALNSVEYHLNQKAFQLALVYMFKIFVSKAFAKYENHNQHTNNKLLIESFILCIITISPEYVSIFKLLADTKSFQSRTSKKFLFFCFSNNASSIQYVVLTYQIAESCF